MVPEAAKNYVRLEYSDFILDKYFYLFFRTIRDMKLRRL